MLLSVNTVEAWQYVLVIIVLLAAVAWIIYKLIVHKEHGHSSCCGCTMSDACEKNHPKNDEQKSEECIIKNSEDKVPDCCKKK